MKGYDVKFDNKPEDKELFTELRAEHGTEKALFGNRTHVSVLGLDPPEGKFNVIVVDPPWKFKDVTEGQNDYDEDARRSIPQYAMMELEEIKKLNVPDTAWDDCVLWLWTTNLNMKDAWELAEYWGFEVKTILTWVKSKMGVGYWLRGKTEHCLLCVKGKPVWTNKKYTTVLKGKAREHSRKPESFYKLVETICKGTRLEYFSREKREGWDQWGDEVDKFGIEEAA